MKLDGMKRIVLLVKDFQKSFEFYSDILKLPNKEKNGSHWAVFQAGSILLCIVSPWPGMPYNIEDFGKSPDEIIFSVDDLEAVRKELITRGVEVSEPHQPGPGIKVAEFSDPDGRRIGIESSA